MRTLKRLVSLALSAVMALSLGACAGKSANGFDAFIDKEFVQFMESDYTYAHIFLGDPAKFGVDPAAIQVNLGLRLDEEGLKQAAEKRDAAWAEFQRFSREKLTDEQKDTYDIYEFDKGLEHELDDEKFDYYQPLFASMAGVHYTLPTMLADWILYDEQDVKDLILLVQDMRPYLAGAIAYTRTQQEKGLLMLDIDAVAAYCGNIVQKGMDSAVLAAMCESVDALNLDAAKTADYKEQLAEAFRDSFLPAYQDILDLMAELKQGENNEEGLAKFEHGKEYFELLLKQNTGTTKSVEEIREELQNSYEEHWANFVEILASDEDVAQALSEGNLPTTAYQSYTEMLEDIRGQLFNDFPAVKNLDYEIQNVNEEIASDSGILAYFNLPRLDGSRPKQLRVNPNLGENMEDLLTYQTVAHEGFPGHMYQFAYAYENLSSPWRKVMVDSLAYSEGYATYAQEYATEHYLQDVDPNMLEALNEQNLILYCAIMLEDIGIHYDGWSLEEAAEFGEAAGIVMDEESYKQLQANPCAFEPYYYGYMQILKMKEKAQEALSDKFEDKAFHEALLKSGTAPFSVVERNIDAYITQSVK